MVSPVEEVKASPHWSLRVTVPSVVGSQLNVVGSPAVNSYPLVGMLKGFSRAATRVATALRARKKTERILADEMIDSI
jgi:hypothetical protein